jgi:ArsR family transcriptional regulator, virulence genes transcriptional regulator
MDKPLRYYEMHADTCKTFGHPKRLMIIDSLRHGELTVTKISKLTDIDKSNLSQHLHILKEKNIVKARRDGTNIFYSLAHPNIIKAYDLISAVLRGSISESQSILSGE